MSARRSKRARTVAVVVGGGIALAIVGRWTSRSTSTANAQGDGTLAGPGAPTSATATATEAHPAINEARSELSDVQRTLGIHGRDG